MDGEDPDSDGGGSGIVDIYGPQGLRMWLRVAIRYSVSRIVPPYRVHELMDVPMAPEWEYSPRTRRFFYAGKPSSFSSSSSLSWRNRRQLVDQRDPISWAAQAPTIRLDPSPLYGEVDGGRDIYPDYDHPMSSDGAPVWDVISYDEGNGVNGAVGSSSTSISGGGIRVYASPMSHGIPCVGYVIEESSQPGRLRNEIVEPIVRRNVDLLKNAGFAIPMKAMAVLKSLEPGTAFTFPDGTVVTAEQAVEPPRPGRKVVICGDTCDSRSLVLLAQDADVVVHEATNTFLPGVDKVKPSPQASSSRQQQQQAQQMRMVTRDAVVHGHSTPFMAGRFAKAAGAKRLVLNHFSPRYKGDPSLDSLSIMMRIESQALQASGLNETQVAAAWDLMVLPIPKR
jgi:ribonuclease Z